MDAYQENRKNFTLLLRYHKTGKESATKSVWLFACPVPDIYLGARIVQQIPPSTIDQIFKFLMSSEYFAYARKLDAKKLRKEAGEYYSWQVHGLDKRVYYLHRSLIPKLMTDFEKLRDLLKNRGSELNAVVKSWEPLREHWRRKAAYLQDAYKSMALCIAIPRPGDVKKTSEFWLVDAKFSGRHPKTTPHREIHRISLGDMESIIDDLRYRDFFGKCRMEKLTGKVGLQVITAKYHVAEMMPWDWSIKLTINSIGHVLGFDHKDKAFAAYARFLQRHKLAVPAPPAMSPVPGASSPDMPPK